MHAARPLIFQPRIAIPLVCFILLGGLLTAYRFAYAGQIFPGVRIASRTLGGAIPAAVRAQVTGLVEESDARGWTFSYGETNVTVTPTVTGDVDATYDIVRYDTEAMVSAAVRVGRHGAFFTRLVEPIRALLVGQDVPIHATINEPAFLTILDENLQSFETPPVDAGLTVVDGQFQVTPESSGKTFPRNAVAAVFRSRVAAHAFEPAVLQLTDAQPSVTADEVVPLVDDATALLAAGDLALSYDDPGDSNESETWVAIPDAYRHWIQPVDTADGARLHFDVTDAQPFLDPILAGVNVPVQEALFNIGANNRVAEFAPAHIGVEVQVRETLDALFDVALRQVQGGAAEGASLVVETVDPYSTTGGANDYGIRELVGVGRSNFAGSPVNRRKNIALGAALLHGQLIKPGEEFSLVTALGRFNPKDGWLPELVIKGNRTVPEIGGGACQFGTTMFRAALNAGLPITERRNHSYTVRYYQPIGTDATIYDPSPDFKFLNDTGRHILIQTRIEGDELIFELWGTKDGRVATQTAPVLSNWVSPPPKKLVETTDLAPGQVRCTEIAHKGVTASFDYHVTYADGRQINETYTSVYRPWQEVCLVGKTPTPEPVVEPQPPADDPGDVAGDTDTQKPEPPKKQKKENAGD